jgi:hypothetical protein
MANKRPAKKTTKKAPARKRPAKKTTKKAPARKAAKKAPAKRRPAKKTSSVKIAPSAVADTRSWWDRLIGKP